MTTGSSTAAAAATAANNCEGFSGQHDGEPFLISGLDSLAFGELRVYSAVVIIDSRHARQIG